MPRLEVRCCCEPRKLLGWLNVPFPCYEFKFAFFQSGPELLTNVGRDLFGIESPEPKVETLILPVANICINGRTYRAIKAEGTPIEILRKIPGFTEASP